MSADPTDLEAKVAFLERTLDGLHEAMVDQGRQFMKLEQRLEQLESKVESKGEPDIGPHDSPPPHY